MSELAAGPTWSFRRSGRGEEPDYNRHPARGRSHVGGRRPARGLDPVFWLTALLLAASFMLGGASQDEPWRPALLELVGLATIGFALPRLQMNGELGALRLPLAIAGLFLLLPLLQLVPLPLDLWANLPGRGELAAALRRFGIAPAALPLSLTPSRTLGSFLWLLIPIGVFLGTAACSEDQRRRLLPIVVAAGLASAILGFLQLTRLGENLRFYDITSPERPVGLFANRNHQALFVLLGLPLAAAWLRRRREVSESLLGLVVLGGLALFALAAVIVSHSRAGLALAAPAIAGAVMLMIRRGALDRRWVLGIGAALVATLGLIAFALSRSTWVIHRLAETQEDYRGTIWSGAVPLAERFSPFGAGLGSFPQVYAAVERAQTLQTSYVNHAHNDYLEVWTCAGYAGVALAVVFMVWLAWRSWKAWRSDEAVMAQAGSLAVALVAAHSLVDYPVRTPAVAVVVGLSCALLALPRPRRN